MTLSRRNLLKAAGAWAALPLAPLVSSAVARAQGARVQRFVGVYHPHGVAAAAYNRRAGETETQFDLTFADSALAPFDSPTQYGGRSFKSRLITFEGVDLAVAESSGTPGHGAATCLFTGSTTAGTDHAARGQSIDQYLARTAQLGLSTPFPTLNLGVGSAGDDNQDCIAHGPGGAQILNELDPVAVFNRVFASLTSGGVDAGTAGAARARGHSVIDFVRGDVTALQARLSPAERLKLDQHLSALREIETRLDAVPAMGPVCVPPPAPKKTGNADPSLDFPKLLRWNGGEPYFDRITDLQVDLLAVALACDCTRFATLYLNDPGKPMTVDTVALPTDVHNEVAHTYSPGDAAAERRLGRLNRYYYGKIARLLQRLDELGVLDSTLVLAGSDMGNPSLHSTRNIPLVLAGGAPGLTLGRRLVAGSDCPASNPYCASPSLTAHNRVLVSICRLFGAQTDTFGVGSAAETTGGWPGL